jgi:Cu+-exporting ATPase
MSIMVGVGRGAKSGVLIKNAEALERMEKVDTLVVDKTGTLTEGHPKVVEIVPAERFETTEVLRLAASLERSSEHPLARAIVGAAEERNLPLAEVAWFDAPTGKGVLGTIDGRKVLVGSASFLAEPKISTSKLQSAAERLRQQGATVVYVSDDGQAMGIIAIADPVKSTTLEAVQALRDEGVRVMMLTGDNATTANAVARRLGIDEVVVSTKTGYIEPLLRFFRLREQQGRGR